MYLTCQYKNNTMGIMKEKNKEKMLQVRVESETVDKAKIKDKNAGLSLSLVVRKLLEDYVNDPQPKLIFG